MDTIARSADVSKATLYAHFSGKETLFTAVMQAELEQYGHHLSNIASAPVGNLREQLVLAATSLMDFMLRPSTLQMFRVIIAENTRIPEICRAAIAGKRQRSHHAVASIFQGGIDSGALRPHDPTEAATVFLAFIKGDLVWDCLISPRQPSVGQISTSANAIADRIIALYALPKG